MKIVALSDTHGSHDEVEVPDGDMLVFCGDFSGVGNFQSVARFAVWLKKFPHKHKVVIAGNHDEALQYHPGKEILKSDFIYLEDSGAEVEGLKVWGSPWTPTFGCWAFMLDRGTRIARKWNAIPNDTDVLVTHGPPAGILDLTRRGVYAGCGDLRDAVRRVKPKVHLFGHIHERGGEVVEDDGTTFINVSIMRDTSLLEMGSPTVFDL